MSLVTEADRKEAGNSTGQLRLGKWNYPSKI